MAVKFQCGDEVLNGISKCASCGDDDTERLEFGIPNSVQAITVVIAICHECLGNAEALSDIAHAIRINNDTIAQAFVDMLNSKEVIGLKITDYIVTITEKDGDNLLFDCMAVLDHGMTMH